jgi:cell fate regulator YaaT (PSP1 superfamily)
MEQTPTVVLVRFGSQAECERIGTSLASLRRGDRVICRTQRGLELGEVLCESRSSDGELAGHWVRHAGAEDELLWSKLRELSHQAADACQSFLRSHGLHDLLLEVEPLLDGRTLYFLFLGEPSPAVANYLEQLADVYQTSIANSSFAQLVDRGCGPGCGTATTSGCGSQGGCAVCVVAKRCKA